jgi:hypothetical protein
MMLRDSVHVDMHVAMELFPLPPQMPAGMDVPVLAHELTDDQVREQQPMVRGQLITRLEWLWKITEAEIERGELEQRQDPRFMELGLRTLDRIMKLYRMLDAPKTAVEEPEEETVVSLRARQQVEQQVRELEAKLPPPQ